MTAIIFPGHISGTLIRRMKDAANTGTYSGQVGLPAEKRYFNRCKHYCQNTAALLVFTRDVGMHSCGWWKNPDYDRCWHLSISFQVAERGQIHLLPQDKKTAQRWCEAIFRDDCRWLWIEPPFSEAGHAMDVWHYRLFCDPGWQPIKPRGEVYSRDWTPADWKSWSDVHGTRDHDGDFGRLIETASTVQASDQEA